MMILIPIYIMFFTIFAPDAFAQSSANVEINNNINSSNTSTSNVESKTNVRIETNGNVTQYSSDEPNQKIEVKAENGQSSIKVNGEEVADDSSEDVISKTPTPTPLIETEPNKEQNTEDFISEIINKPMEIIKKIFSFLENLGI